MPTGSKSAPGELTQRIAAELRAEIARKNVSNKEVAAAIGISAPQLSNIVNGKKHVDVEQLDNICFVLGLDVIEVATAASKATPGRFAAGDDGLTPL